MCSVGAEYQQIVPSTQVQLTSTCLDMCDSATSVVIQWTAYRGFQTGYPNNDVKWILYSNMSGQDNALFYR